MEIKQHTSKKSMSQSEDLNNIFKNLAECKVSKYVGHNQGHAEREIYSTKYLLSKEERPLTNNLISCLKLESEEQKSQRTENRKTIEKIKETKSWFFGKIYKVDRLLTRLTKEKKKKKT